MLAVGSLQRERALGGGDRAGRAGGGGHAATGGTASARPRFAGESYALVDVGAYLVERLPAGNLVSLVMAAEEGTGPAEAADVLEKAVGPLSAADRHRLGETFLSWFRLLLGRAGVDLDFLEDRAMMERMAESGELRATLEERFQALHDYRVRIQLGMTAFEGF